jgi:hypothetical protein
MNEKWTKLPLTDTDLGFGPDSPFPNRPFVAFCQGSPEAVEKWQTFYPRVVISLIGPFEDGTVKISISEKRHPDYWWESNVAIPKELLGEVAKLILESSNKL